MAEESALEAAAILLQLPYLIAQSESLSRRKSSFQWATKRKRSYLLLSSQPSVPAAAEGATPNTATCETDKEKRPEALSPATPLLFPPSESDEKTKHHPNRSVFLKRKRDELLKVETELMESIRVTKEEIKKFTSFRDEEKALNLKLKAALEEGTHLRLKSATETQTAVQIDVQNQQPRSPYMAAYQQPFINKDQTAENNGSSQHPFGHNLPLLTSSGGGLSMTNGLKARPSLPLDLNAPLQESFLMEFGIGGTVSRNLAAQARQRRIQICRSKAAHRLRIPVYR